MSMLNFDQDQVNEIPVRIGGNDYVLREADGETGRAYRLATARGAKVADGKVSADLSSLVEAEYVLVGGCLCEPGEKGKPVGTEFVKKLPQRVVSQLFDKAQEISGLGNKPKTEKEMAQAVLEAQKALVDFRKASASGDSHDPKAQPADSGRGS